MVADRRLTEAGDFRLLESGDFRLVDVAEPPPPAGPTITSDTPSAGTADGGTTVIITGLGFTGATAVKFGTVDAASFVVDSDTQITAVTPAHDPGTFPIVIEVP